MASACPHCESALPPDFGLVLCTHCGASIMLDEHGEVSTGNEVEANLIHQDIAEEIFASEQNQEMSDLQSQGQDSIDPQAALFEYDSDLDSSPEAEQLSGPLYGNELVDSNQNETEDEFYDFSEPTQQVAGIRLEDEGPLEDLSDLAEFGNSAHSQANEGSLLYSVIIGGIDSADQRSFLRAELQDNRFMWNVDELIRSIRGGQLQLDDISAVKASLLIQRLMRSQLEIHWSQHLIQSTSSQGEA